MTESRRKTTLEESIKIVEWCLDHDKSYKDAESEFNVSYAQVYQW
ncbi:helix-turn-helix domain-containing protein [Breznakia pachnodae]|uniref:Transposase n=1 Tax=Breznakia pachnodae TaxID=265178 RepID=A0ABU0E4R5_9FIRM|nr:helix-turn-helix domain-containing protein [Breznakia pachnodae]MDQ0361884.1 transposase [Breznakia pachnodae]